MLHVVTGDKTDTNVELVVIKQTEQGYQDKETHGMKFKCAAYLGDKKMSLN